MIIKDENTFIKNFKLISMNSQVIYSLLQERSKVWGIYFLIQYPKPTCHNIGSTRKYFVNPLQIISTWTFLSLHKLIMNFTKFIHEILVLCSWKWMIKSILFRQSPSCVYQHLEKIYYQGKSWKKEDKLVVSFKNTTNKQVKSLLYRLLPTKYEIQVFSEKKKVNKIRSRFYYKNHPESSLLSRNQ